MEGFFYTYIIQSLADEAFRYKGHCIELQERLKQHNSGPTKSIKHKAPFKVVYYETSTTRAEAIEKEKYWKTAAGRRYLQKKIMAS
ncbi:MAG: GIY-YIG nuclease family protein [Flavipsychrobacter sp.]|nr:GIY-YIG nuclease family protein [Flavipsychrobacter sp.]